MVSRGGAQKRSISETAVSNGDIPMSNANQTSRDIGHGRGKNRGTRGRYTPTHRSGDSGGRIHKRVATGTHRLPVAITNRDIDGDLAMSGASDGSGAKRFQPYGGGGGSRRGGRGHRHIAGIAKRSIAQLAQDHLTSIDILRTMLKSRWNEEQKYLNLDNLDEDPNMKPHGLRGPGTAAPTSKVGPAISKLISELYPQVESISFAGNHIRNISTISTIAQFVPNLRNLSLQNNSIQSYSGLDALSGKQKLKNLRELILIGNPLVERETSKAGDETAYRSEITRRFPSLKMLDMKPVAPTISFDVSVEEAPKVESIQIPFKRDFFSSPAVQETASSFLVQFFSFYDTNRQGLLDVYDPNAVFSMVLNTSSVVSRVGGRRPDWGPYIASSRNLQRVRDLKKRISLLIKGNMEIIKSITSLPRTTHLVDREKIIVDAMEQRDLTSAMLIVVVHGEFQDPDGKKSFDRSFVLVESSPNSRARQVGLPFVIVSDQLVMRGYVEPKTWNQQPQQQPPQPPQPSQPSQPPISIPKINALALVTSEIGVNDPNMTEERAQQVVHVAESTRLKILYAMQCLSENGWDTARALQAFEGLKNMIPPEAFQ